MLRRFDDFEDDDREKLTPIVLLADEGQNSILAAEEGLADHNTLDKIREARGTLILAMQSYSSALPALKGRRDLAETIFTNLNNHVIGAIRDETGREMAANIFGKEWQKDRSYSYGGPSNSMSVRRELRHIFHTGIFTRIPKFRCIVFHVAGRWAQGEIPPLTDDGTRVSPRHRLGFFDRLSVR
ncbi:MAG TPA: TraM recognition domain-containing protein [Opitutaceae bacterium]|nr:TraM recognition domain-containing protein [Opitutaceae bacterium]